MSQIIIGNLIIWLISWNVVECRKGDLPSISLLVWVGEEMFGEDQLKTDVSNDIDQGAPVTVVNDTTYIATSEVMLIAFMCKSSNPIEWEFSNSKWFLMQDKTFGFYLTTGRRTADDINSPNTFTYYSEVTLLGDSRMYNGKYTCKDSRDDRKSTSITVFWEGGPFDNVFALSGQNITVYIDKTDTSKVIFPCHVNNPYAEVSLMKEDEVKSRANNQSEDDTWVPVPNPDNYHWTPETGFTFELEKGKDYPDNGNYKCVLNNADDSSESGAKEDAVYMTFSLLKEPDVNLNQRIKTNATLSRNKQKGRYECCSSSSVPPTLVVHSCGDPMTCKELIPALKTQFLAGSKPTSAVNRYVMPHWMPLINKKNGSCSYYSDWYSQFDLDMVQCVGDGITALQNFFPRNDQNLTYNDWNHDNLKRWLKIRPSYLNTQQYPMKSTKVNGINTYQVYSGSTVFFRCEASFYFFSYGIRFSTDNTAKQRNVLPDTFAVNFKDRYQHKIMLLLHNPPLAQEMNVTITPDMKTLNCHVPVTNSSDWVTSSIQFSVKQPQLPKIISEENILTENVFWKVNDTGVTLSCKVSGDPEPHVIFKKEGKLAANYFNVSRGKDGSYNLHVETVTYEVHGQYACVAVNFAGQIEKIFNVFVEESSGSHVELIITVVIVLLAVLGLVVFITWKTVQQKKSLNNLREYVYPDGGSG